MVHSRSPPNCNDLSAANNDHTLDSTLAPATNAAGLAPPSSASGPATVGSGGGLSNGTAGTGTGAVLQVAASNPPTPTIRTAYLA